MASTHAALARSLRVAMTRKMRITMHAILDLCKEPLCFSRLAWIGTRVVCMRVHGVVRSARAVLTRLCSAKLIVQVYAAVTKVAPLRCKVAFANPTLGIAGSQHHWWSDASVTQRTWSARRRHYGLRL